jgi:hypothetical protein
MADPKPKSDEQQGGEEEPAQADAPAASTENQPCAKVSGEHVVVNS